MGAAETMVPNITISSIIKYKRQFVVVLAIMLPHYFSLLYIGRFRTFTIGRLAGEIHYFCVGKLSATMACSTAHAASLDMKAK
jgi:hypothetical protein